MDQLKTKQPALTTFSKITLRRGQEVVLPGVTRRPDAPLFNVLARMHAGGMDIHGVAEKPSNEQRMFPLVVGVPWERIAQWERAPEGV